MITVKKFVSILALVVLAEEVHAQHYHGRTELQSTFIDVTGLFGVDEPASVTQFSYQQKKFGFDLYHGFSLVEFGKTIQSIVTPSYIIKLDSASKFFLKPKVEIANLETAGGGFVRPGIHIIYKPKPNQALNLGSWLFHDFRDEEKFPNRLNGFTVAASYQVITDRAKWKWTNEIRILYVDVLETLQTAGVLVVAQVNFKPLNLYVGGTAFQSAYRSDENLMLNWNVVIGRTF